MPAANGSWRSWVNPRPDRADPESVRAALNSLEKFLRNPTFAAGIGLGSGTGTPTYDPVTGTTAPPTTTPFNQDTVDEIVTALPPNDGAAPGTVTGLALTAGIGSIRATWDESTAEDVENGWGTYRVQLDNTSNTFPSPEVDRIVGANFTTFVGLTAGVTYYVRVAAIDAYGNQSASWSSVASLVPGQATGPDIAANTITAANIFGNTITAAEIAADTITAEELAAIAIEVGKYIQSDNYDGTDVATGDATVGFRFEGNGNMEAQNARIRGDIFVDSLTTTGGTGRVEMDSSGQGEIFFRYTGDTDPPYIYSPAVDDLSIIVPNGDLDIFSDTSLDIDCDTGAITITGATDVNITAAGDDVRIEAADDIILDPNSRIELAGPDLSINVTNMYRNGVQQPMFSVNTSSGTTDGSSDITITHGLGGTPAAVVATPTDDSKVLATHSLNSTTFKARFRHNGAGAVGSGVSVGCHWIATRYP